ncbi:MAG: protein kinase [Myxococcales bacterium]|nr:protein kinase [Myxococcales bacterium]
MPRTFTLLRTLGRGAHGSVHLAELRDEDDYVQTLAVKRLLPECSGDAELAARLKDEARLLALLQHDHVVRVHGLTRIDGGLAILMEPVHGVDLAQLVKEGPLPARVATSIVGAVADALDAAWTTTPPGQSAPLRVVHRDIKPSNVMVTPRGGVKVMDFGVARATFESREVETRSQQLGTARYMAPERWLEASAEHRSDVFSLGITFLELLSGQAAHRPRLSPEPFAEDLRALLERVPEPELRELVAAMCAFEHTERPAAEEVATRCRAIAASMEGPTLRAWAAAHVVPREGQAQDPTASATIVHEDASVTHLRAGLAPVFPPAAVALFAAVALLVFAGIWTSRDERPASTDEEITAVEAPASLPSTALPSDAVDAPTPAPVPVSEPPAEPVRPRTTRPTETAPPSGERSVPEPASEPAEAEADPVAAVRFVLAEGLTAETDWGAVRSSPSVLELPAEQAVEVRVQENGRSWSCTIAVGSTFGEVRIAGQGEGGCTQ